MPYLAFIVALLACTVMPGHGQMAGGLTKQDPNDPEHMARAWKAAKGINEDASNAGPYHMIPIKIVKAESQVVAGVRYIFEVLFGESTCKKGHMAATELSASNCELKEGGNRALYKVELWEKPWENFEQFNVEKIRNVAAGEQI
ncbi:hypothetical protein Aduo_016553 [Ancylostoma duodenale]